MKKILLTSLSVLVLASSTLYAKNDHDKDYDLEYDKDYKNGDSHSKHEYHKDKKKKDLPYGMKKKVQKDGSLPPGWKKKIRKGQVLDDDMFRNAKELKHSKYKDLDNTRVYRIEDKIFRVIKDTREIIEILSN